MTFEDFLEREIWRDSISIHSISSDNDFCRAVRHASFFKHPNARMRSHAHHRGGVLQITPSDEFKDTNYEDALQKVGELIGEKWWEIRKEKTSKVRRSKKTSRSKSSTA